MQIKKKQKDIEECVYNIIDDLAHEFGLDVDNYPRVLALNKKTEHHGEIMEKDISDFEYAKLKRVNAYLISSNMIIISRPKLYSISEESGHFLYHDTSKINPFREWTNKDYFAIRAIDEMFGYFFSKIIYPKRETTILKLDIKLRRLIDVQEEEAEKLHQDIFIYHQGYGLGERLYRAYLKNDIKKKDIINLLHCDMDTDYDASNTFDALKDRFWPSYYA